MVGGRFYVASKGASTGTRRPRKVGTFRRFKRRNFLKTPIARTIKRVIGGIAEKRKVPVDTAAGTQLAARQWDDITDANWYFLDISPDVGSLKDGNKVYMRTLQSTWAFRTEINPDSATVRSQSLVRFIIVSSKVKLTAAVEIFGVPTIQAADSTAFHCPILEYQNGLKVLVDKYFAISNSYSNTNPQGMFKVVKVNRKLNHTQVFNDDGDDSTAGRFYYVIAKVVQQSEVGADNDCDVYMSSTYVYIYNDI